MRWVCSNGSACRPSSRTGIPASSRAANSSASASPARSPPIPPVMLMDEPFSAVDPVVRGQLQDEFLRLQAELHKTIVFVTHDIDEAIKMGDQVAVMRVGGTLAQLAPPAELLARPTDPFVAGFVGRDRGYRALGFVAAGSLPLRPENPIGLGAEIARAASFAEDGWVLVVDNDRQPQGWLAINDSIAARGGQVTPELLNLGGTLASQSGTLREALDAALSSPSGRGVVVTPDGRFAGTVTAAQVLDRIDAQAQVVREQAHRSAVAGAGSSPTPTPGPAAGDDGPAGEVGD